MLCIAVSVPPTVSMAEDDGSVEVCATLDADITADVIVTLATMDGTGKGYCIYVTFWSVIVKFFQQLLILIIHLIPWTEHSLHLQLLAIRCV